MENSDSENIIEATPPKEIKRRKRKKKSPVSSKHSFEDYLMIPKLLFKPENAIKDPAVSTANNAPYVFYTIEEIKRLPSDNLLCIHTVGIYNFFSNGHFLENETCLNLSSNRVRKKCLLLNLKYLKCVPNIGQAISAYGCLEEEIFLVKFYRVEVKEMIDKYVKNLKFIRNYVPTKYLFNDR